MTINWSKTAADCRLSEYLAPLVANHFTLTQGRWQKIESSQYHWKWERPTSGVTRLLFDLQQFLPKGSFWDRSRYRMGNTGSMNLVKAHLVKYLTYRAEGMSCTCGYTCRYPQAPDIQDTSDPSPVGTLSASQVQELLDLA